MTRHVLRHRQALLRLAVFALLVVMPILIVAGHLAEVFGPLHDHDPALAACASGAWPGHPQPTHDGHPHVHAHGGLERHWHRPDDGSVVVVGMAEPDRAGAPSAKAAGKPALPPALVFEWAWRFGVDTAGTWPTPPARRWTSRSPEPLERPPRA